MYNYYGKLRVYAWALEKKNIYSVTKYIIKMFDSSESKGRKGFGFCFTIFLFCCCFMIVFLL